MLIREHGDGSLQLWNQSQRIDGLLYPPNIEALWSDAELRAVGLYRLTAFVAPDNYARVGSPTYEKTGDAVREIYETQAVVILPAAVTVERERRIAAGCSVTIGVRTFTVQTRNDLDFRNINGLVSKAILLVMRGDTVTTMTFRDADNAEHQLTGAEMISMGEQVALRVDAVYKASWRLKDSVTIANDYDNNSHWPE